MKSFATAAGLLAVANAFTQPVQPPSYGALLTPNTSDGVTTGQTFQVTWTPLQPDAGVTVSLVLCNGPSTNCVLQNTAIAEGIPASQASYSWNVPCSLPSGVQNTATGYGMLIIVDGTGQFQYSTQFSVSAGSSCGSSSSSSSTTSTSTTSSSSSSSSSSSGSSLSSGSATSSNPGWQPWASSSTIVVSSTPAAVSTPSMMSYSTPAAQTTTMSTYSYSTPSSSATVSTPQAFTGAAALPTAFVNAAGVMGAAALAVLAL